MDRQERTDVFREANKRRAERRDQLKVLLDRLVLLATIRNSPWLAKEAREIAEGLERIGDVQ